MRTNQTNNSSILSFGDSSLRTFTKKHYQYTGKEKDAESGLYYYGARYYPTAHLFTGIEQRGEVLRKYFLGLNITSYLEQLRKTETVSSITHKYINTIIQKSIKSEKD